MAVVESNVKLPNTNQVKGHEATGYCDNGWRCTTKDEAVAEAARIRSEEGRAAKYIIIYERKEGCLYGMMWGEPGTARGSGEGSKARKLIAKAGELAEANPEVAAALAALEAAVAKAS